MTIGRSFGCINFLVKIYFAQDDNFHSMSKSKDKIFYVLAILVLAVGIFLRFWQLGTIPPGIQYDEAYNGLDAIHANETGDYALFYPGNTGREGLHINAIAFFIRILGVSNFSLRFANAMWGSLTLVGFCLLLRELKLSRLSVLLGTFMMAFSFWHLDFSRTAFRAIMVPFCIVWMLYFLLRGLNGRKGGPYLNLALSGFFLGLGFYSYIAFRIAPLILVIFGAAYLWFEKDRPVKNWKSVFALAFAFIICVLPIGLYFYAHLNEFLFRSEAVSIFNAPKMTPWQAFGHSLWVHLKAFFIYGDNNSRHNYNNQPLIPSDWIVFFVLGLIISAKEIFEGIRGKWRSRRGGATNFHLSGLFYPAVLAQSILWVMLVPGIMSIEGIPHSLRIIGMIPGVFLTCLFPLEYVLKVYRRMRNSSDRAIQSRGANMLLTLIAGLVVVILIGGLFQAYVYFGLWARDQRTAGGFERKLYLLGMLVKDLDVHAHNYIITANNTSVSSDGTDSSLKTVQFIAYPKIKSYLFFRPVDGLNRVDCNDIQIVFQESDQWLRDQYRAKCPGLRTDRYSFEKSKYVFYVMSVAQ